MRLASLVVCAAFVALSGSSAALAQSCGKGMLWPHVRQAGDCLTDEEITAGQTGVYNGPVNTNPDVSAIKPMPETQNVDSGGGFFSGNLFGGGGSPSTAATCSRGLLWPFVREEGDCPTQIERRQAAAAGRPIVVAAPAPPAPPPTPEEARCERSWLWPFVREPGDCQTDAEKK